VSPSNFVILSIQEDMTALIMPPATTIPHCSKGHKITAIHVVVFQAQYEFKHNFQYVFLTS